MGPLTNTTYEMWERTPTYGTGTSTTTTYGAWKPNPAFSSTVEDADLLNAIKQIRRADETSNIDEKIERLNEAITDISKVIRDSLGEY